MLTTHHRCGLDCLREDGELSSDRAVGRRGTAGLGRDLDQLQPRATPLNTGALFRLPCTSQENWEREGHRAQEGPEGGDVRNYLHTSRNTLQETSQKTRSSQQRGPPPVHVEAN